MRQQTGKTALTTREKRKVHIGIVDDNREISALVQLWLEQAGHTVSVFYTGEDFVHNCHEHRFDVVLLDWILPDLDGDKILQQLQKQPGWDTPIIFVTARNREDDVADMLELGADDYIIKPLHQKELLARIGAVTRRRFKPQLEILDYGIYQIDLRSRTLYRDRQPVKLTEMEFNLVCFMFANVGNLLSRDHILSSVWRYDANVNTRTVDTHMSRIRKKLKIAEENGWRLSSIYQRGYRLEQFDPERRPF
ncbi:MAG TPA: response regulator transcription factor [Gammaproteobacteria bacterium]|nr:response regulator transcription factor [Gammaproteobacteria bacterium]